MLIFALLLSLLGGVPETAHADNRRESPFWIHNEIDLPLVIGAGMIAGLPVVFDKEEQTIKLTASLDRDKVFFLDRGVTNYDSKTFSRVSDALTFAIPATALTASLPWGNRDWATAYEDLVLITESMLATSLVNQLVRHTFERPRPYMYRDDPAARRDTREDYSSFFSGHTASAFAAGIAFWRIQEIRHPDNPNNWIFCAAAVAGGSAVAVSRVFGGQHFWTDVIAASAVGGSIGVLVPALHRRGQVDDSGGISLQAIGPGYASVGYRF